MSSVPQSVPVRLAVLGAGPIGLEAALAGLEQGWDVVVFEAGPAVAHNVRNWGHVRMFTPWKFVVSPRMAAALTAAGLPVAQGRECPTGDQAVASLYDAVASLPALGGALRLSTTVVAVAREGLRKDQEIATPERAGRRFRILVTDPDGAERSDHADVVIDTTGSYTTPNTLGDGGIPALGERALDGGIARRIPDLAVGGADRADYAGVVTLLAGVGFSAQTAARDLAVLAAEVAGTRIEWLVRGEGSGWGRVADDPLPARAALVDSSEDLAAGGADALTVHTLTHVERLVADGERFRVTVRGPQGRSKLVVDRVLALTGAHGDPGIYRQLQVHECYATDAPITLSAALLGAAGGDCMAQTSHGVDTLRNPEPRFFILGSKSYGRNNQFLLRIGWEQVDEVIEALAAELTADGARVGANA